MSTGIRPSDVVRSAADEIGNCMAVVRSKAINAEGSDREKLFGAYDDLLTRLQELVHQDLKAIDQDPQVQQVITRLLVLNQRLAVAKREMLAAKTVIDRTKKVLGWADEILRLLLPSTADV
ncbi:hypothetical protein MUU77_17345 [Pseudoxanthomonas sp. F37]|uniref:hypothetical protein n=1 Tax=Pseudoxanthomonas sp. F37 TaxID=2932492 RepID=UPI001FD3DC1B|nr:hypothetical protein [Pseudoxanthomonas sp. F37]UOV08545.1 hypothetical protein MUU77_17345 [Pseudoxanthomonas sp. F37]